MWKPVAFCRSWKIAWFDCTLYPIDAMKIIVVCYLIEIHPTNFRNFSWAQNQRHVRNGHGSPWGSPKIEAMYFHLRLRIFGAVHTFWPSRSSIRICHRHWNESCNSIHISSNPNDQPLFLRGRWMFLRRFLALNKVTDPDTDKLKIILFFPVHIVLNISNLVDVLLHTWSKRCPFLWINDKRPPLNEFFS